MRYLFALFFTLIVLSVQAAKSITLTCKISGQCPSDTIHLYQFYGTSFKKLFSTTRQKDSSFVFKLTLKEENTMYHIGFQENNLKPFWLGTEKAVTIEGNCDNIRALAIRSEFYGHYANVQNRLSAFKNEFGNLINEMRSSVYDTSQFNAVGRRMGELDLRRLNYIDSLKKANPFLSKVAALNTYISFQQNKGRYDSELNYFVNEYFSQVNFNDPDYNRLPQVYDVFNEYMQNLLSIQLPEDVQRGALDRYLNQMTPGSMTHRMALSAVVMRLMSGSNGNLPYYAEKYLAQFKKEDNPAFANMLERKIQTSKNLVIGGEAPDFVQNTPEGKQLNLHSLRGKVLLIDFWASWCGPCRRENPNVVKLYQQYKDKGFDILGVSLDQNKQSWIDAIAKDGLPWNHISDLAGWQNAAAQMYGVTSIPHTILLDKNGKILARNLRGQQLDNKLKELFGEN